MAGYVIAKNQYDKEAGPTRADLEAERKENPQPQEQYSTEAGPTREDYERERQERQDRENEKAEAARKKAVRAQRKAEFDAERDRVRKEEAEKVQAKADAKEAAEIEAARDADMDEGARRTREKQRQFEVEQDQFNRDQKEKSKRDKEEADKAEKQKTESEKHAREMEILKEKNQHALNMQKIRNQKPVATKQGTWKKPSKLPMSMVNPFPGGGGSVKGSGFPDIDPMGGMGGKGRNMLSLGGLPSAMPAGKQKPQPQQTTRTQAGRFVSSRPQNPLMSLDPLAGLRASAVQKARVGRNPPHIMQMMLQPKRGGVKRNPVMMGLMPRTGARTGGSRIVVPNGSWAAKGLKFGGSPGKVVPVMQKKRPVRKSRTGGIWGLMKF